MVFSSFDFLLWFLPFCVIVYLLARKQSKNLVLLFFSIVFYAYGAMDIPAYLYLILISVVVNWIVGMLIGRQDKLKKVWLALGLCWDFGCLFVFKYADFFIGNLNRIPFVNLPLTNLVLPLGISFFTFQIASYLIDVYRNQVDVEYSLVDLGTYILMFPQLIAGPIVRASDITENLDAPQMTLESTWHGMIRLIRGLGKKVILANALATVIESNHTLPTDECSAGLLWLITLCYAFQIYFDFSGYSDMAIGMGEILGFRFPENFRFPYIAVSVRDFWRRWHMTLSSWLRDYVYIPLGGNRKGTFRTYLNLLLVFLICGFWHGASWNFVLWGLWYGLWLILERIPPIQRLLKKIPKPVTWFFTMVIVLLGWVLFRNLKPDETLMFLRGMFGGNSYITVDAFSILSPKLIIILAACLFLASPLAEMLLDRVEHMKGTGITVIRSVLALAVLAVCIILLMSDTYNPFIYFRF